MTESRRSTRVLARIPVSLIAGEAQPEHALTAVVNRHGALILSPVSFEEDAIIWVQNEINCEVTRCRVTWIGSKDSSGAYKLGVEFVNEVPTFWGSAYEEALKAESEPVRPTNSHA